MNQATQPSGRQRLTRALVTLACLVVVGAVLWQLLPKASFSSDLSRVGQGKPALVMLREVHVVGGELVKEQMLMIYPEFQESMEFLLVHTGHPDGIALAEQHNLSDGSLVLFDASGQAIARMGRPASAGVLRQFITDNL